MGKGERRMDDLISRQAAINLAKDICVPTKEDGVFWKHKCIDPDDIRELPSVQPGIIRCKNCKWWDKYSEKQGYCMAAKHGYYSSHWEIHIRRTYGEDFFCADAEPIKEE
jgi:hypothetical protein